jgi:hypothetical protein
MDFLHALGADYIENHYQLLNFGRVLIINFKSTWKRANGSILPADSVTEIEHNVIIFLPRFTTAAGLKFNSKLEIAKITSLLVGLLTHIISFLTLANIHCFEVQYFLVKQLVQSYNVKQNI